jgi:Zn-dependent peptidase ImmA (M78 family)
MARQNLEERAEKKLRDTDCYRVPVPIHHVAERLNLTLEATALGDKVSGMLVVQGNEGSIGYNSAHARVRQRFTISHEIAHYLLHARRTGKAQLFIDKQITYRRDEQSSTGMNSDEIEANKLGAALLMPRGLVQQEVRAQDLDLDDSEAIEILAKKFQVSTVAMGNRLQNLRMLAYEN